MIAAVRKGLKEARGGDKKLVALVTRVSTDRQASNPEGSLKTQLQRLRAHLDYKNATDEEDWVEVGVYELKGVSGKVSMGTEEYAQIFGDIRAGRVNTILCAALERLCRSVKDFLWFFEFINEHGVEFVCLKQKYDTTTPQGKLFVTIMIALAEFEREQTSERLATQSWQGQNAASGTEASSLATTSTPTVRATSSRTTMRSPS